MRSPSVGRNAKIVLFSGCDTAMYISLGFGASDDAVRNNPTPNTAKKKTRINPTIFEPVLHLVADAFCWFEP